MQDPITKKLKSVSLRIEEFMLWRICIRRIHVQKQPGILSDEYPISQKETIQQGNFE